MSANEKRPTVNGTPSKVFQDCSKDTGDHGNSHVVGFRQHKVTLHDASNWDRERLQVSLDLGVLLPDWEEHRPEPTKAVVARLHDLGFFAATFCLVRIDGTDSLVWSVESGPIPPESVRLWRVSSADRSSHVFWTPELEAALRVLTNPMLRHHNPHLFMCEVPAERVLAIYNWHTYVCDVRGLPIRDMGRVAQHGVMEYLVAGTFIPGPPAPSRHLAAVRVGQGLGVTA